MVEEEIFKNLQNKRLWEHFSPILKRKWKRKETITVYIFKIIFSE